MPKSVDEILREHYNQCRYRKNVSPHNYDVYEKDALDKAKKELLEAVMGVLPPAKNYIMKELDEDPFESHWSQGYDRSQDDIKAALKKLFSELK